MPIRICELTGSRTNECTSASVLRPTLPASMRTYSNGHESDPSNFGQRLHCACDWTLHRSCAASWQWRQGAEALRRCRATFNNGEYLELVTARAHCQNLARVRMAREDSHRRRDHASMRRHRGAEAFKRFGAIINIHVMLKLRAEKRVAETWITPSLQRGESAIESERDCAQARRRHFAQPGAPDQRCIARASAVIGAAARGRRAVGARMRTSTSPTLCATVRI